MGDGRASGASGVRCAYRLPCSGPCPPCRLPHKNTASSRGMPCPSQPLRGAWGPRGPQAAHHSRRHTMDWLDTWDTLPACGVCGVRLGGRWTANACLSLGLAASPQAQAQPAGASAARPAAASTGFRTVSRWGVCRSELKVEANDQSASRTSTWAAHLHCLGNG